MNYETHGGQSIDSACKEAVNLAREHRCLVTFEFNDINLTAAPETDPKILAEIYMTEMNRRHDAWIASPEYAKQQAEYERQDREKKAALARRLESAPPHLTLRDADNWKKTCDANKDGYGGGVMSYAERWARLMESEIEAGKKLPDIAEECSHAADVGGITGFMYGCAVSILSGVWIYGEELRRWHNLKTQIKDEGEKANQSGGVLNPALLKIG